MRLARDFGTENLPSQVFRQEDAELIDVLTKLRHGICDGDALRFIKKCGSGQKAMFDKGIKARLWQLESGTAGY